MQIVVEFAQILHEKSTVSADAVATQWCGAAGGDVLLDVIVGVLLGNATVGLAASYQISVPEQPLAVRVVVLPDETDEGVAVGEVGADVVLTVTLPIVAGFEVQTLAFWTVNV